MGLEGELGQKGSELTTLSFLRNASTEDFAPKGLKYAHD